MRTTLDNEGRIVLPEDVRQRLGLRPGDTLEMQLEEDGLRFMPARPISGPTSEEDHPSHRGDADLDTRHGGGSKKTGLHYEDGMPVWHGKLEDDAQDIAQLVQEDREERIRKLMKPF